MTVVSLCIAPVAHTATQTTPSGAIGPARLVQWEPATLLLKNFVLSLETARHFGMLQIEIWCLVLGGFLPKRHFFIFQPTELGLGMLCGQIGF
jgi:hypothetical protein